MVAEMRRRRDELARIPGVGAAHLFMTTELTPVLGGRPTPRRWALFCGWDRDVGLDPFLEGSPLLRAFTRGAREVWHVTLEPVRLVSGSWRGWTPSVDGTEPMEGDEPLVVMTYGRLRWRYVPTFLINNRRVVVHAWRQPGLLAQLGLSDTARTASTFTVWRSQADAVRFAYGSGDHKPVIRPSRDTPWADDYFFARFRPLASKGTWKGRDPVADALAARGNGRRLAASQDHPLDPGEIAADLGPVEAGTPHQA